MNWINQEDYLFEKIWMNIMTKTMGNITFKEWFNKIQWLKDKVILPNDQAVSKSDYITAKGFNIDGFNSLLFKEYNKKYPVNNGRRYKK
jgi:hypothetical protein